MAHAYGIRAVLVKDNPGGLAGTTYAAAARADIFGRTLQPVEAPVGGEILFLVTALAMNAGDPLMAIAYR